MPRDYADRIAGRAALEFSMHRLSLIAAVAALMSLPADIVLAQTAPNTGTETTPKTAATAPRAAPPAVAAPFPNNAARCPCCRSYGNDDERTREAEEKEACEADDQAAGDRSINRPRHGSGALSPSGAEGVSA